MVAEQRGQLDRAGGRETEASSSDMSDLSDKSDESRMGTRPGSGETDAVNNTLQLDGIARAQLYFKDKKILSHDPAETVAAVREIGREWSGFGVNLHAVNSGAEFPEEIIDEIKAQGRDVDHVAAVTVGNDVFVNAGKIRPSEVGRIVLNHEIGTHVWMNQLPAEVVQNVRDLVRKSDPDGVRVIAGRLGFDPESPEAVDELIADRFEFEGNDWRKLYAENRDAIDDFARENGYSTASEEFQRRATRGYFDGNPLPKVPWYEKLYAAFKAWIRKTFAGRLAKLSDVDMRKLFRDALAGLKKNRAGEGAESGESSFAKATEDKARFAHRGNKNKINELLPFRDLSRGLRLDAKSVTAVRQSFVNNIASLPKKIKSDFLNAFDSIFLGTNLPGMKRSIDPDGFVTVMTSMGFKREGSSSAYLTENGNTVRLGYHSTSAKTFKQHGVKNGIVCVTLEKGNQNKKFSPDNNVDLVEYVFPIETVDNGKLAVIFHDIGSFLASGKYVDHAGAIYFHTSGSSQFRKNAELKHQQDQLDNQQADAVLDQIGQVHFKISDLWHGSAADFEKPSLQHVGSGEGNQVFGWGFYASDQKGIGQEYADKLTRALNGNVQIEFDGKKVDLENAVKTDEERMIQNIAIRARFFQGDLDAVAQDLSDDISAMEYRGKNPERERRMLDFLDRNRNRFTVVKPHPVEGNRNLYKLTFFPDKTEKLLVWNNEVDRKTIDQVFDALEKKLLTLDQYTHDAERQSLCEDLQAIRNGFIDGQALYETVSDYLGSQKAASEFLYSIGIDGVKYPANSMGRGDGSQGWNYVAFSDKDIRVDDHTRFKIEEFSDEDMKFLVDASKDFASKHYYDVKGDADFLEFYRRHNLPVNNEHDAHFIMTLALEEVQHEKRLASAKKAAKSKKINEARAIKEFADENPLFAFMQSFVGNDFTINPGKRFEGTEFAGDYISPEYKKYGCRTLAGFATAPLRLNQSDYFASAFSPDFAAS